MARPTALSLAAAALALLAAAAAILAHPDDPKSRNRIPPFSGHGFQGGGSGDDSLPLTVDFPSSGMTLLSWLSIPDLAPGMTSANDCWGYVSPSGREYAIIGLSDGTAFVEVTDPMNPEVVSVIPGPNSIWRDIKTYLSFAYAVSEGGSGIQVMSLANVDSGVVTLVREVTTGGSTSTHNVALDTASGFLYRCGGSSNGLRIYSLADPSNPAFVASWPDRYVHDAQVVTYASGPYAGKQIAFCCSGFNGGFDQTGLDVLDVTNKASIVPLARISYSNPAYSHQAWLSEDRRYLYLDDELDEGDFSLNTTTKVIDVQNLSAPFEAASFSNSSTAIGHNLYTKGNLIFEANYRSGLRVFDATSPLSPTEIGYFDTWPEDDNPSFNGLWSNYPWLPSGTIVASDIEKGLFLLRVGEPRLAFAFPDGLPATIAPWGATVRVEIVENAPGDLVPGSAVMRYDAGSGFVDVPLSGVGSGLYDAEFPAIACGTEVAYYFSARDVEGFTITSPNAAPAAGNHATVSALGVHGFLSLEMESDPGFTVGAPGDDATTGVWTRVDPRGTAAQPEDDHTPFPGTTCWVTGQGSVGGSDGENDVDGGKTTLVTGRIDLSVWTDPIVSYWRWYSNNTGASPGADVFTVGVSSNDGATWTTVETVGPSGAETVGGWFRHEFRVSDFVALTSAVKLRFVASDLGAGSIVEAAVDDLEAFEYVCADCNGNGIDDASDIRSSRSFDTNGNGVPDECEPFTVMPPDPGVAGGVLNTVSVMNATPGGLVCFYGGFSAGTTDSPDCPGLPLDIRKAKRVACRVADGTGAVTAQKTLGNGLVGRTLYVQCVDVASCTASNLVIHAFP